MRLAVSQIAWDAQEEDAAFCVLQRHGFTGLEVAPPRVAGPTPYEQPGRAAEYAAMVERRAGLALCSMQSIWFGRQGSLFGPERRQLLDYTLKAVDFARAGGIANLVFGCPKARVLPAGVPPQAGDGFFRAVGEYAAQNGAVLALEPNPPIYETNYINTTPQALEMVRRVGCPGFMVNLDVGTMVENAEPVSVLAGSVGLIHHVHVSEPGLGMLEKRPLHRQLARVLRDEGYGGWVSVEMRPQGLENLEQAAAWVAEVFG